MSATPRVISLVVVSVIIVSIVPDLTGLAVLIMTGLAVACGIETARR